MGCGQSSQLGPVTSSPPKDNAAVPAANGAANVRPVTAHPKHEQNGGAVATTMDELNVEYTTMRLLLLGAAESGKTTLLEQIRLLYKQNYSEAEFIHRKAFIYNNILLSIRKLIEHMQTTGTAYSDPTNARYAGKIMDGEDTQFACFTADMADAIQHVWKDGAVQKLYERRSEINLNDSTKYFLENFESINKLDFKPSARDLIMSYVPTVGVQNVIFSVGKNTFQLFDIGGQRIDRRKWATMYDGIDAILFCIAISEYNQTMMEDPTAVVDALRALRAPWPQPRPSISTLNLERSFKSPFDTSSTEVGKTNNRLRDSLSLLEKISHEPKFEKTPLLLFLNEVDVFREKLPIIPLGKYMADYKGKSAEDALVFVEGLAKKAMLGRDQSLMKIYRTCAIDTDAMKKILEDVFTRVLKVK